MHRVAAILLAVCVLGLGSGLLRFAHEAEHAHDDAHAGGHGECLGFPARQGERPGGNHDRHDERTCEVHALLNAPLALTPVVTVLVHLGLFVEFLTPVSTLLARLRLPGRIDCRGPPFCIS
jgi:hypothetical protein